MTGLFVDFMALSATIITYSLYKISLKKFDKDKMLLLFWVNNFAYIGFVALFFFRVYALEHSPHAWHKMLFSFTAINIPLYFLMALSFVASLYILNLLLNKYEVSLIIALTQISLLFTATAYVLLGDPLSWSAIIGITMVFTGAIISSFHKIDWKHPLAPLKKIPKPLLIGATIESALLAIVSIITYICTEETTTTSSIMHFLKHVHSMPFSFTNPFYFNVGVRFFIVLIFIGYLWYSKQTWRSSVTLLKENTGFIVVTSLLYFAYAYSYQEAYLLTPNKSVFAALTKFTIPMALLMSVTLLKEPIKLPKIIGAAFIVAGGLVALL